MFSDHYARSRHPVSLLVFGCAESDDSGLGLLTQAVIAFPLLPSWPLFGVFPPG